MRPRLAVSASARAAWSHPVDWIGGSNRDGEKHSPNGGRSG
jgi:hypothetical protein